MNAAILLVLPMQSSISIMSDVKTSSFYNKNKEKLAEFIMDSGADILVSDFSDIFKTEFEDSSESGYTLLKAIVDDIIINISYVIRVFMHKTIDHVDGYDLLDTILINSTITLCDDQIIMRIPC